MLINEIFIDENLVNVIKVILNKFSIIFDVL